MNRLISMKKSSHGYSTIAFRQISFFDKLKTAIFSNEADLNDVSSSLVKSDKIIKEILKDAGDKLFVSSQVAAITRDPVDLTRIEALQQAVAERIGILEYSFLLTLNSYVHVSKLAKNKDIVEIMLELKTVSFDEIRGKLPPILQYLEEVMQLPTRKGRLTKLILSSNKAIKTDKSSDRMSSEKDEFAYYNPPLEQLFFAVNQVLEDVESQEIIPDIQFLAYLVVVREEIRLIEQRQYQSTVNLGTKSITKKGPLAELAFLKELMLLNDTDKRKAFLMHALWKDDSEMQDIKKSNTSNTSKTYNRVRTTSQEGILKRVRPGRLIDTLDVMKDELTKMGSHTQSQATRLLHLRSECFESFEEIATGVYIPKEGLIRTRE